MTIAELVKSLSGQHLAVTGKFNADGTRTADAGQCTAVAHYWQKSLGLPIVYGDAFQIFDNAPSEQYYKTPWGPNMIAPSGSIIIWNSYPENKNGVGTGPHLLGGAGHIAVVISANSTGFVSLDQNWPTGSVVKMVSHDYAGVKGWLYPKVLGNSEGGLPEATKQDEPEMIKTPDQMNALFRAFRGRNAVQGELDKFVGKASYEQMVAALDTGTERDAVVRALVLGQQVGSSEALEDLKRWKQAATDPSMKLVTADAWNRLTQTADEYTKHLASEQTQPSEDKPEDDKAGDYEQPDSDYPKGVTNYVKKQTFRITTRATELIDFNGNPSIGVKANVVIPISGTFEAQGGTFYHYQSKNHPDAFFGIHEDDLAIVPTSSKAIDGLVRPANDAARTATTDYLQHSTPEERLSNWHFLVTHVSGAYGAVLRQVQKVVQRADQ
jgi:hypothetical protein